MGEKIWLNPEERPQEAWAALQHPSDSPVLPVGNEIQQKPPSGRARRVQTAGPTEAGMGSALSHGAQTMAAIIRVNAVHPKPCWELRLHPAFLTPVHLPVTHSSLLSSTQCTLSSSLLKHTTVGCHSLLHTLSKEQMQVPPHSLIGECSTPIVWRECREYAKTWESHSRSGK